MHGCSEDIAGELEVMRTFSDGRIMEGGTNYMAEENKKVSDDGTGTGGIAGDNTGVDKKSSSAANKWVVWFAGIIGMLFVAVVFFRTGYNLPDMANPDFARGTISYLIVLAFIILGVLMILAALFGPFQDDQKSDAAFRRAREIYMSVVGIVGTIVGFYYGSATITPIQLEMQTKTVGSNLVVQVSGGVKPYRVVVKIDGKPTEIKSERGLEIIDICKLSKSVDDKYIVEVTDAKDHKSTQEQKIDYGKMCLQTDAKPAGTSTPSATK